MKRLFQYLTKSIALLLLASTAMTSCDSDKDNDPKPSTTTNPEVSNMSEANKFIYDFMAGYYLWNEPVATLRLNGKATYDQFFQSILDGIDAKDGLNHDDGHWVNGKRSYYYSYIERTEASKSRALGEKQTGSGITYMSAMRVADDTNEAWLLPAIVVPGSPAEKAGIHRGDAVSTIDGIKITTSNYQTMAEKLKNGGVTVTHIVMQFASNGSLTGYTENPDVVLQKATFDDPAIYKSKVVTLSGGKKAGYLLYMSFDKSYDDQLIEIFSGFKQQGISELILDLRYNGGGHVLASTLLATLITGENHKGQIFNKTIYNASRTAKGETGEYKFATATTPEGKYDKIATAATAGLGLDRIYILCSERTASASELIINGLRGVDATVRLIGTTTNGKNVGMEVASKDIGNYHYEIAPITFYSQNAKGFRNYADGFNPDYALDENSYLYADFGTESEPLYNIALRWINTGSKPASTMSSRAAIDNRRLPLRDNSPSMRLHGSRIYL